MSLERESVPVATGAGSRLRQTGVRVAKGGSDETTEACGRVAAGSLSPALPGQIIQLDPALLDQVLARLKTGFLTLEVQQRLEAIEAPDYWSRSILAASILLGEDLCDAFQSLFDASGWRANSGPELAPLLPVRLAVTVVQKNWITASAFTARTSTQETWRIVVDREMVLTGNRSYLVRRDLIVVGLVRSVDRREVEAAATMAKRR